MVQLTNHWVHREPNHVTSHPWHPDDRFINLAYHQGIGRRIPASGTRGDT